MILKKGNVERIVKNEAAAQKLKTEGFAEVKDEAIPAPDAGLEGKPLEEMTVPELKALAKGRGLEGVSGLNKEELLTVLQGEA